ncbi:hypothetical protein [Ruegeria atlantica]|uniref:Recombinase n=1 Tax=Ruegeria atlantica TaxID=81569 RepID=A0A0P1E477_9RHOB|nr:hypothetical protein [Ruegeria atlantica]CUH42041.1 hypothetical protein RUM4293_00926 [Ruegeria atlantica]
MLHPNLISEFVSAYQTEFNRLTVEISKSKTEQEQAKTTKQIDKIVDAIAEGMFHPSLKAKMDDLEARKKELEAELSASPQERPVLLHPGLADLYKEKVADLSDALNNPSTKTEATSIIRGLLTEIRLLPVDGKLLIELVGELAGLLALGQTKTASERCASGRSATLVAGVGFAQDPTLNEVSINV